MTEPRRINIADMQSVVGASPDDEPNDFDVARKRRERADDWARRIPARFRDAHLTDIDEPEASLLFEWASLAPGPSTNLVLLGPVGVGKTHAAAGALRVCHEHGRSVLFAPIVEALDALRPGGPPDTLARLARAGVLLLDDLGAERPTDWTSERLYGIVNRRWLDKLPIIVTSNVPKEKLEEVLDPRLYSRLVHEATAFRFGGKDRRRP